MPIDSDSAAALEPFLADGWLSSILYEVKSGKEATVFCCRGGTRAPVPLVAAKVYRPLESRGFRNDAMYIGGRLHMAHDSQARRAVNNRSDFGRKVQYGSWILEEWECLDILHDGGVSVPKPLARGERAILMPFLGDEDAPSPLLHEVDLARREAARVIDAILDDVELMLDHDCVHGDLSPYNIMLHRGRAVIIDFPQAIDPRLNRNGFTLLSRDVENVCRWAARHGVDRPAGRIAGRLWRRFVEGELG